MKGLTAALLLLIGASANALTPAQFCDVFYWKPQCAMKDDPSDDPASVPEMDSLGAPLAGAIAISVLALGWVARRRRNKKK